MGVVQNQAHPVKHCVMDRRFTNHQAHELLLLSLCVKKNYYQWVTRSAGQGLGTMGEINQFCYLTRSLLAALIMNSANTRKSTVPPTYIRERTTL